MKIQLIILMFILFNNLDHLESSQAYREGYYNNENDMPGSSGDSRNLPSLPFSTDTNRYADGHTSNSALGVTSPHFPIYNVSFANTSDRFKYHVKYMESAAIQGIALYGDGDAIKEDAKVKIISQKNYESLPKPNMTFPVYAAIKWNPSDFAIQIGEFYKVEVLGSHVGFGPQLWYDGGIRVDANGYESHFDPISNCYVAIGRCRPHLKKRRRLPSVNWMSLACAIGQFVRPVFPLIPGQESEARYFPLDEAEVQNSIFPVGMSYSFRANNTGQLICFANDAHTLYWNNKGKLDVTVTRISWPPTNNTIYQEEYLPACDSAIAIYDSSMKCNPQGGGAGWEESNARNPHRTYGIEI